MYSLLLVCYYMFWHSCHLQEPYTNLVKTYSNRIVLQQYYTENVQFFIKIQYSKSYDSICLLLVTVSTNYAET